MRDVIVTESEARSLALCVGCGKPTTCPGGLCCWSCFKYIPDALKWSGKSFLDWQRGLPELPQSARDQITFALPRYSGWQGGLAS